MKLQPALIFGENMVLQRQKPIPVWGRSVRGDLITVSLGEHTVTVKAGDHMQDEREVSGVWEAILPPMEACSEVSLSISSAKTREKVSFEHVAIGEVWLAGGQSNMEFWLEYDGQFEETAALPEDPDFRFFRYPQVNFAGCLEKDPYPDDGFWRSWGSREDRGFFSGPAAYMGLQLRKKLGVPVGIVGCNWGGSSAAGWCELGAIKETPALQSILTWQKEQEEKLDYRTYIEASEQPAPDPTAEIQTGLDKFMMGEGLLEFFQNMPEEMPPVIYSAYMYGPRSINAPGQLYTHMLTKVAPFALRGFIWYQGEEDDTCGRQAIYGELMKTMILSWRKLWKEELPFLQVELAPYGGPAPRVAAKDWPKMRQQQRSVTRQLKDVYDICIMDSGHPYNIHVRKKKPVGDRLALLALKHVYKDTKLLADSPSVLSCGREEDQVWISFADTGEGLVLREVPDEKGTLREVLEVFCDGKSVEARCEISEDTLRIYADEIKDADEITVCFCEMNYCTDPLFGSTGLPVFPFTVKL